MDKTSGCLIGSIVLAFLIGTVLRKKGKTLSNKSK